MMKAVSGRRARIAAPAFALALALGHAAPTAAQLFYNGMLDAQAKTALAEYTELKKAQVAELEERLAGIDAEEIALKSAIRARGEAQRDLDVIRVLESDKDRHRELRALADARYSVITKLTFGANAKAEQAMGFGPTPKYEVLAEERKPALERISRCSIFGV